MQQPSFPECSIGFDIGSSGIRGGTLSGQDLGRVTIDYLADVWTSQGINSTTQPTIQALTKMASESGCAKLAGGYSAWRLAVSKSGGNAMADRLQEIYQQTGTTIFVIPQQVEGQYAYLAAKLQLGDGLRTPYIWDIGGGSMQIASDSRGWGAALGQKAWRKSFCEIIKASSNPQCPPNPVGRNAISQSKTVLNDPIQQAATALGGQDLQVTAVSTLIVKSVHPILLYLAQERHLIDGHVDKEAFDITALESAISLLADRDDTHILGILDGCRENSPQPICAARFAANFVTDMLLIHSFMDGLGIARLSTAEASITNVPGILHDTQAWLWHRNYACYLSRLRQLGTDAYMTDPHSCPSL